MAPRSAPVLLLAFAAAPACTYFDGDPHVVITSTPAGAEVLVDGRPTGKTTPVKLELGGMTGKDHAVTVRKRGYEDETRRLYHYTTGYTSRWIDGATTFPLPSSPICWTFGDTVTPFGVRWRYVPHEVHVVLYREGQAPVRAAAPPAPGPAPR